MISQDHIADPVQPQMYTILCSSVSLANSTGRAHSHNDGYKGFRLADFWKVPQSTIWCLQQIPN